MDVVAQLIAGLETNSLDGEGGELLGRMRAKSAEAFANDKFELDVRDPGKGGINIAGVDQALDEMFGGQPVRESVLLAEGQKKTVVFQNCYAFNVVRLTARIIEAIGADAQ